MKIDRIATIWLFAITLEANSQGACQLKYGGNEFKDRMCSYRKNAKDFDTFYALFLTALDSNDYERISQMIKYPISAKIDGKKFALRSPKAFTAVAAQIFNHEFTKSIFISEQKLTHLSSGIMLGNGEIWFNTQIIKKRDAWKITAINNDMQK